MLAGENRYPCFKYTTVASTSYKNLNLVGFSFSKQLSLKNVGRTEIKCINNTT